MAFSPEQVGNPQPIDSTRPKRRMRLNEAPLMTRRLVPQEVAQTGDLGHVAEDFGLRESDARDACIIDLLRRVQALEDRQRFALVTPLRRAA